MSADKYTRCPDCGRKTVYWKGLPNGEDNYRCRMPDCHFYFFTIGADAEDKANEARWRAVNGMNEED